MGGHILRRDLFKSSSALSLQERVKWLLHIQDVCSCSCWPFFHQVRNSLTFWHIVDRVMAFVKALFDLFIKAKGHIILLLLLLEWPFVAFNKVIYDLQLLPTKPEIKVSKLLGYILTVITYFLSHTDFVQ